MLLSLILSDKEGSEEGWPATATKTTAHDGDALAAAAAAGGDQRGITRDDGRGRSNASGAVEGERVTAAILDGDEGAEGPGVRVGVCHRKRRLRSEDAAKPTSSDCRSMADKRRRTSSGVGAGGAVAAKECKRDRARNATLGDEGDEAWMMDDQAVPAADPSHPPISGDGGSDSSGGNSVYSPESEVMPSRMLLGLTSNQSCTIFLKEIWRHVCCQRS